MHELHFEEIYPLKQANLPPGVNLPQFKNPWFRQKHVSLSFYYDIEIQMFLWDASFKYVYSVLNIFKTNNLCITKQIYGLSLGKLVKLINIVNVLKKNRLKFC